LRNILNDNISGNGENEVSELVFTQKQTLRKRLKTLFFRKKIGLGSLKFLHLPHQFTQWGAFLTKVGVITG
jgi:hypothetical protein